MRQKIHQRKILVNVDLLNLKEYFLAVKNMPQTYTKGMFRRRHFEFRSQFFCGKWSVKTYIIGTFR